MSSLITINVINNSPSTQNFFFFQQPATYVGGQTVYSNSLYSQTLLPNASSGSILTFMLLQEFYAAVQEQIELPVPGQPSGYRSAIRPIALTPAPGGAPTNNKTTMSVSPLGLSLPTNDSMVQAGAFRIETPIYEPVLITYNGGMGVKTLEGSVILSNFITLLPNQTLDCQPVRKFYVQTGSFTSGIVINFTSSSITAAVCDATSGYTTFKVTYRADGYWDVIPSAATLMLKAATHHPAKLCHATLSSLANNAAEIKNETGAAVICTGDAANFNLPVTIQNLSNPNVIYLHSEYQVGPPGGPYVGLMCTHIAGTTATFN